MTEITRAPSLTVILLSLLTLFFHFGEARSLSINKHVRSPDPSEPASPVSTGIQDFIDPVAFGIPLRPGNGSNPAHWTYTVPGTDTKLLITLPYGPAVDHTDVIIALSEAFTELKDRVVREHDPFLTEQYVHVHGSILYECNTIFPKNARLSLCRDAARGIDMLMRKPLSAPGLDYHALNFILAREGYGVLGKGSVQVLDEATT